MQDASLVSGMLSAIQDFVRDSFQAAQGQGINRMNVGDLDVWIEEGPYAILACVIRGVAPRELRDRMAEVLENVHREYSAELDRFEGDSAPFNKVHNEISRCLEHRYREEAKTKSFAAVYATAAIVVLLVGGWLGWRALQYARWERLVNTLREQPGFVITSFGREHGKFVVRGMRDPLAAESAQFIGASNVNASDGEFHWGGYYALDDGIVEQRAKSILVPPSTAILAVKSGVLTVSGAASANWVKDIQARGLLVPGIRAVELSPELNPARLAFDQAKTEIEKVVVKFPVGTEALSTSERLELRKLAESMQSLVQAGDGLRQAPTVEVLGHTDSTGAEVSNLDLSQRRADRVAWELGQLGIPERILRARGIGTTNPLRAEDTEENRQFNRCATFRVSVPAP
jgi:OOP family OmpA-OmpF porin